MICILQFIFDQFYCMIMEKQHTSDHLVEVTGLWVVYDAIINQLYTFVVEICYKQGTVSIIHNFNRVKDVKVLLCG